VQPLAGDFLCQAAGRPILPNRYRFTLASADLNETACAVAYAFARIACTLLVAKVENEDDVV
jgi:hypothetical protein